MSATPVAGNVYDKYGSPNPIVRRLVSSFLAELDALVAAAAPALLIDVGCGEGKVTRRVAATSGARATGLDLEADRLRAIAELVSTHSILDAVRSATPWTLVLARPG